MGVTGEFTSVRNGFGSSNRLDVFTIILGLLNYQRFLLTGVPGSLTSAADRLVRLEDKVGGSMRVAAPIDKVSAHLNPFIFV